MKKLGKIKMLAVASLAAIVLAATFALAQTAKHEQGDRHQARGQWGERGEHRGPDGEGWMFKQLNLTDAQKEQMKQLRQSFEAQTKPLHDQLRAKHQELRQTEQGSTFDEALATQKLTEAAGLQAKLMGAEFKLRQDMLAVLTPEQKTQLEQARAQFKANHAEGRGRKEQ